MIAPRDGLAGRALVVAFLVLATAACGGAASSPTGVAAGDGDVVTTGPVPCGQSGERRGGGVGTGDLTRR